MGAIVSHGILHPWETFSTPSHGVSRGDITAQQLAVINTMVAQDDATAHRSLFIEDIAPLVDIIDPIFDMCTPQSLIQLSMTCRLAHRVVHEYISAAWSVDLHRMLSQYFEDPRAFRSLQARTGALIAGSTALSFFTRTSFGTESDLDIYVYMPHCGEVGSWILNSGYVFQHGHNEPTFEQMIANPAFMRHQEAHPYAIPGVARVLTFIRPGSALGPQRQVHLVAALGNPLSVILGSHSTCVMNIITYEKAYCLFARATIVECQTIASTSSLGINRRRAEGKRKYAARGYSVINNLTPSIMNLLNPGELRPVECGKRIFFSRGHGHVAGNVLCPWPTMPDRFVATGIRYLGDGATWEISLTLDGVDIRPSANASSVSSSRSPLLACSWLICYRTWSKTPLEMVFYDFIGPILRNPYLIPRRDRELLQWMENRERFEATRRSANIGIATFYDEEFMTCTQSGQMRSIARWLDAD
ncbi:hypothetical protein WOLCODRAFT_143199 [Wolfiporia cocos MD-104 SS10]|uniref:Uncharacterized protein n=1 Tax=Wolfiporia cocos (strain MD-104) TaxID=742152 RepID=A0A2H3JX34_WOLCO|nr:hypothetical protein WOLCODRAFT_143199 [Wolfiporia cocos MD-104 SS10]